MGMNLTESRFGGVRAGEESPDVVEGDGADEDPVSDDGGDDEGGEDGDEDDDDVGDVEVVVVLVRLVHHLAHDPEMQADRFVVQGCTIRNYIEVGPSEGGNLTSVCIISI